MSKLVSYEACTEEGRSPELLKSQEWLRYFIRTSPLPRVAGETSGSAAAIPGRGGCTARIPRKVREGKKEAYPRKWRPPS